MISRALLLYVAAALPFVLGFSTQRVALLVGRLCDLRRLVV